MYYLNKKQEFEKDFLTNLSNKKRTQKLISRTFPKLSRILNFITKDEANSLENG